MPAARSGRRVAIELNSAPRTSGHEHGSVNLELVENCNHVVA